MDEYALLDTPAMLNYILKKTSQRSLTYIGHSLGTTTILMLLSSKPEYNYKINVIVLLAPVSYWKLQSPTRIFISVLARLLQLLSPSGLMEFQPQNIILPEFFKHICLLNNFILELCYFPYNLILGNNREQFQLDKTPQLLYYYPAGISAKVFYHYKQHIETGKFNSFDHGTSLNMKYYGNFLPNEYNLTNIFTKKIIFSAKNDPLSTKNDIDTLISKFPIKNNIIHEIVEYERFNHADFVLAKDVEKFVYHKLLKIVN